MNQTPRQALSKRLFNAQHRLDAIATLLLRGAELDFFDHEAFVQASGLPRTAAHNELKALVDLQALSTYQGDRRVKYSIQEGPFWEWTEQLLMAHGGLEDRVHGAAEESSDATP